MKEATNSYKSLNTVLMYLGIFKEEYWHLDYKINNFEYNGKNYFWDISKKATWFKGEFDENGIYLYKGADGKNYYSVINLAQYALGSYEEYLKTNSNYWLKEFKKHADWLVENQVEFKRCKGIWKNKYPMAIFKLNGEWSSSLAQAFGISVLTRAYLEYKDEKFRKAAINASEAFFKTVEDGGVYYNKNGFVSLEEYTTNSSSYVLNGYISAIWSLYDLKYICNDIKIENKYNECIDSLEKNIERWDTGFWSRYDLWEEHYNICSYFYHQLHVKQLKILYILTNKKIFNEFYIKWEKNRKNVITSLYALSVKIVSKLRRKK